MRWIRASVAIAILVLAAGLGTAPVSGQGPTSVSVMVDFGTGRVLWSDIAFAGSGFTAWNATVAAAELLGLPLNVSYFGGQPFVNDIGDMRPVFPDYWHFLLWAGVRWDLADTGPAGVSIAHGEAYGWFLARDAPWNFTEPWPGPQPSATPDTSGRQPVQMFRYDLEGTGLAVGPGPTDPVVSWSYDTGAFEITATPAFARGTVYLPTWTGFVALDEATGSLRWRNPAVAGASSPALFDGRIYVGGRDGALHVLGAVNGTELWNITLQPNAQFSGITSSPRIAHGRVYIGTFNETGGDGAFYAIDLYTHEVVWSRRVSSVHLSSAAIAHGTVYVGLMGRFRPADLGYEPPYGLLALDAETGTDRWFVATNGSVASSPAVSGDLIFTTTKAGEVFAIETDGRVRWRSVQSLGIVASPAVSGNVLAIGFGVLGTHGAVQTLSREGDVRWTAFLLDTPVSASPTIAGDYVYAATNDANGTVHAWRLSARDAGEWARHLEPRDYLLSSPVVHNGALYVASDNGIVYRLADVAFVPIDPFGSLWLPLFLIAAIAVVGVATLVILRMTGRSRRGP